MAEFFQAFGPLYAGFRERATEVAALLRASRTVFVLVTRQRKSAFPRRLFFAGVWSSRVIASGHSWSTMRTPSRHATGARDRVARRRRLGSWRGLARVTGVARSTPSADGDPSGHRPATAGRGAYRAQLARPPARDSSPRGCPRDAQSAFTACGCGTGSCPSGTTLNYRLPLTAFGRRTGLEPRRATSWRGTCSSGSGSSATTCGPREARYQDLARVHTEAYLGQLGERDTLGAHLRCRPVGRSGRRGDAHRPPRNRRHARAARAKPESWRPSRQPARRVPPRRASAR